MGVHRLFCGSHRAHLGPALGATAAPCLRAAVPCCSPHTLSLPLGSCRTCFLLFQSKIWGCSPSHPAVGSPPHQGPLGPGVPSTQSPPRGGAALSPQEVEFLSSSITQLKVVQTKYVEAKDCLNVLNKSNEGKWDP